MSNLSTVTDNMLPVTSETFVDNLAAGISAGADTVPLLSLAEYSDGDSVVLTVDPGTADQATFIGKVDGNEVIDVEWTEGNVGASHSAGATVIDYDSATHYNVVTKLLRMFANQDGTLKTTAVQEALNIPTTSSPDWTTLATAPSAVSYLGQRSYEITIPGVDYTDRLNPGTRLRTIRNTAAPTRSTSLNGTNQYWENASPNKMTFTDDFAVSAWVKLSSYQIGGVVTRYNGTNGWSLYVDTDGTVSLRGNNGGSGNLSRITSTQALPLNKWVHVAAQLDMSAYSNTPTTSYIMIDGVDVPCSVVRSGTNPTSLSQAGSLQIGAWNSASFFSGKIAQASIFSAKVPQATMLTYISQGITGSETNLASAYSFDGVVTDIQTTTPNDLVAGAGSPTATVADSPFGGQANGTISPTVNYGIIQSASFSTDTTIIVQVPAVNTIATAGGVASLSYSAMKAPYGFPSNVGDWSISYICGNPPGTTANVGNTWSAMLGMTTAMPIGKWRASFRGVFTVRSATAALQRAQLQLDTAQPSTAGGETGTPNATRSQTREVSSNSFQVAFVSSQQETFVFDAQGILNLYYQNSNYSGSTYTYAESPTSYYPSIEIVNGYL